MTKRSREPSIEFEMMDTFIVIKYYQKRYAWYPPADVAYTNFLNDPTFDCSIIHNSYGQAMFNVEDLRKSEDVLRQEVNPLDKKDTEEWVIDKE